MRLRSQFGKRLDVLVTPVTIKKIVAERGFGFIAAEDAKDCFFHRSGLDSPTDFDRLAREALHSPLGGTSASLR